MTSLSFGRTDFFQLSSSSRSLRLILPQTWVSFFFNSPQILVACRVVAMVRAGLFFVHHLVIYRFWKCRKLSFFAWVFRKFLSFRKNLKFSIQYSVTYMGSLFCTRIACGAAFCLFTCYYMISKPSKWFLRILFLWYKSWRICFPIVQVLNFPS